MTAHLDSLDLHIAFAVCADRLGLDGEGCDAMICVDDSGQRRQYAFSGAAVAALEGAARCESVPGWVELISVGLVEEAVDALGEAWRGEAVVAVELELAERAEGLAHLANLARQGPVTFCTNEDLSAGVRDRVLSVEMLDLI